MGSKGGQPLAGSGNVKSRLTLHAQSTAQAFLRGLNAGHSRRLDLEKVLDLADQFCRAFVDCVAEEWNVENHKGSSGNSDDSSQHCDSPDEYDDHDVDEMIENSLYQPCPILQSSPTDAEPVYATPNEEFPPPPPMCNGSNNKKHPNHIYDTANPGGAEMLYKPKLPTGPRPPIHDITKDSDKINSQKSLENKLAEAFALQHSQSVDFDASVNKREVKKRMSLKLPSRPDTNAPHSAPVGKHIGNSGFSSVGSSSSSSQSRPRLKDAIFDLTYDVVNKVKKSSPKHTPAPPQPEKFVPMTPQVKTLKEGVLDQMVCRDEPQPAVWAPCRLCLISTHGGVMLNVYLPPTSDRPVSTICCRLLTECRSAQPGEIRAHECIFLLKGEENLQCVFRCRCYEERHDWLCTLKEHISSNGETKSAAVTPLVLPDVESLYETPYGSRACSQTDLASTPTNEHPPSLQRITSCNDIQSKNDAALRDSVSQFPWYHGCLSRVEAAQKVTHQGKAGHGVYLVRRSESKENEYCVTFNYQGKAKHLRLAVEENGLCRVQHLSFKSIFAMVEHYRSNPLPIDTKEGVPLTLRSYVINLDAATGGGNQVYANANGGGNRIVHRRNKSVDFNIDDYEAGPGGSKHGTPLLAKKGISTSLSGTYYSIT